MFFFPVKITTKSELVHFLVVDMFSPRVVASQLEICDTVQPKHLLNLRSFTPGINRVLLQKQDPLSFKFRRKKKKS